MTAKTLILGIGNTLLADEGAGIHMLDYLREHHPDLPHTTLLDGGTLSFTLAPWIEAADNLVVIDAAELHGEPGTVKVFCGQDMDRFAGRTRRSVHEVSLGDLLAICSLTDALPENRALVALQPRDIDWGHELSAPLQQALPQAAQHIVELVGQWQSPSDTTRASLHLFDPLHPARMSG